MTQLKGITRIKIFSVLHNCRCDVRGIPERSLCSCVQMEDYWVQVVAAIYEL